MVVRRDGSLVFFPQGWVEGGEAKRPAVCPRRLQLGAGPACGCEHLPPEAQARRRGDGVWTEAERHSDPADGKSTKAGRGDPQPLHVKGVRPLSPPSQPQTLGAEGPWGSATQLVLSATPQPHTAQNTLLTSPQSSRSEFLGGMLATDLEENRLEIPQVAFQREPGSSLPISIWQLLPRRQAEASVVNRPTAHRSPSQKPTYASE